LSLGKRKSECMSTVSSKLITSEKELLAQPADEYMSPAQLDFFKRKLRELEAELRANAGETTEHLRETVLVPDPADRATIEEEHALELRTRDRERKLIKKEERDKDDRVTKKAYFLRIERERSFRCINIRSDTSSMYMNPIQHCDHYRYLFT